MWFSHSRVGLFFLLSLFNSVVSGPCKGKGGCFDGVESGTCRF